MAEGNGKETDHDVLKHSDVENAGTEVAEAALLSEPIALGSEEAYQEPGALGSITVDTKEQMEVSCPESGTFVKSNVDVKEQSIDTKEQMEISCPETGALVNSTVDAKEQPGPQSGNVELKVMNQTGNAADYGGTSNGKQENGSDLSKIGVASDKPMVDVKAAEVQSGGDHMEEEPMKKDIVVADSENPVPSEGSKVSSFLNSDEGDESGTEADQAAFMKELENFHRERSLEFKPPRFYGEGLNCLKLWRAVTRLGGYEQVTSCKLWRQVGESFKPPKTCTTVSWTFRGFYEKALLEYEKHKIRTGELQVSIAPMPESVSIDNQIGGSQTPGSGRARRDAAARAMQGWHSQRLLSNGEVGDPIIKDKSSVSLLKRDKQFKNIGVFKKKKISQDHPIKAGHTDTAKPQVDAMIVDLGAPADWVKINVRRTKDCFEIYALVPGLLREEVHVQSDPVGRLVISGEPEQPDNPWGVTSFKKIVSLPARIDPHQTSAVVTLHGQLFVRAPFEQSGQ